MDVWSVQFPLARLGGDFALAQAQYALKFDDYPRAQRVLKVYRTHVDLSAQLAEVMQLEWNCDTELQNPADIKELAADIQKRFPDLPLAKDARDALAGHMPLPLVGRGPHGPDAPQ
jgi:protein involved in temperature-dependent protein secretion